jgi:hypothetical protein
MSLDDRLRDGLRRSAEAVRFDEDAALDRIQLAHRRSLLRTQVMRVATAAVVVVSLFVGAAVVVPRLATANRYRSAATVSVAASPNSTARSTPDSLPVKLADPGTLALAASTRRAALLASHLAPNDTRIDFRATRMASDVFSLMVTAPTAGEATAVTRNWVAALGQARLGDVRRQLAADQRALNRRIVVLRDQLHAVDAQLAMLDPLVFSSIYPYDNPQPGGGGREPIAPSPSDGASTREFTLVLERLQLIQQLTEGASKISAIQLANSAPNVTTQPVAQSPATNVDQTSPATVLALAGWLIAIIVVLAAAALAYRLRTRDTGQAPHETR